MRRRDFMKTAPSAGLAVALGAKKESIRQQESRPLVIDGMAEIRVSYPMSLISEVLDSGTNVVRISLGSPLPPDTAYQIVLDTYAEYERHIKVHGDYIMKASCVADIDAAKKKGRLALMYYFQNSTPIGFDLDNLLIAYPHPLSHFGNEVLQQYI